MSKTEKNTNLVKRIENAVASERGNDIFLMIPEDPELPLENMAAKIIENEIRLFVTPGSVERGWVIQNLPHEPIERVAQQNTLIIAEITQKNMFSRIVELRVL